MPRIETDAQWQAKRLALLPSAWVGRMRARFDEKWGDGSGYYAANTYLRETTEPFEHIAIPLDASDSDICAIAERKARDMFALASSVPVSSAKATRAMLAAAVRRAGVVPPDEKDESISDAGAVRRMTDSLWWRRKLRTVHARELEGAAISLGFVHSGKGGNPYASDETVKRRRQQKRRNAKVLEETIAINERDEGFTLAELAARSVANPEIRRGELMTRIKGFEEIARGVDHAAEFVTVTCPSRMHSRLHGSGADNPTYDGTTPRQAQQYLAKTFANLRAYLWRRGVGMYGFRIAEPHHDGCPHWHLLVFVEPSRLDELRAAFRRYFLKDSPTERGADKYRVKFEAIDWKRGTAAGYIAKYVAKNIDGYRVEKDLLGNDAIEASHRVDAWASTWGIRQFQQVGGPPVGVWRELRRLGQIETGPWGELSEVEKARSAADAGNWRRYVEVQRGPILARADRPVQMRYGKAEAADPNTGEIKAAATRYGDEPAARPVGLLEKWSGEVVRVVRHVWRIVSKAGGLLLPPWTRVNNCSEGGKDESAGKDGASREGGENRLGGCAGACADHGRTVHEADFAGDAGTGRGNRGHFAPHG